MTDRKAEGPVRPQRPVDVTVVHFYGSVSNYVTKDISRQFLSFILLSRTNGMNKPLVKVFLISSLMFFTVLPNTPSSLTVRADSTYTQKTVPDFANATGSNITVLTVNGTPEVVLGRTEVDTWYRQPTPASPPARAYGGLATIFNSDELLLYGGWDGASDLDDTWLYNFTEGNWSQPDPPEKPSARDGFAMAPVFGTDEAVLFGGSDTPLNDTWIFNASLGLWFQQFPAECPPARTRSVMVPVWGDDKVVLFGGSAQGVLMNDTWVYDIGDNNWTVKAPAESPPARESPAMSMVPEDDKVVLFGGNDGWPYLNDTWVYDPGSDNWSLQNTTIAPAQTFGNVLCPLFGTGELMLYGGANLDNQTWLYDYSSAEWRSLLPPASPLGRHDYAMAPVFGTDQAILFSGADSYRQSTWMFNFSGYCGEGCFTSAPRDLGGPCSFSSLEWNATVSAGTGLRFQLRTADSLAALNASHFVGPGGDPNATYDVSGAALWPGLGGGRWFQYRALLTSTVPELSPVLREVSLDFDFAPDAPEPLSPGAGDWANGSATYSWLFRDNDSADQGGFELQAGPDASLSSVTYDSGNVGSGCQTHTATLPDGSFFWRVRTCDGEGTWGPFSQPRAVRIDGDAPEISVVTPPGGPLDRTDFTLYGTAYDALSGLASVEARTDGGDWLPANGTSNWHVDLALAKGPHEVDVRATDAAGNANITEVLYNVNRPPQVNLTSPLEGGVYNMTDRVNLTVDAFDLDGDLMTFIWKDGTVPLGTGLDMSQRFSEGNHTVSVTVSDGKGHEVVRSVNFTVYSALPIPKLGILSPFENQVLPSGAVSINFTVANFTISPSPGGPHIIYRLDDGPETGWYSSLNVNLSNVPNGDHVVRLWLVDASGRYLDNPESAASIDFSVNDPSQNLPDLAITPADISLQPKDPREGDMVSITFRVSNTGISDSRGFNVILYIDGNETAYSIFRALGAGANSTAKLTWNAVRGNHTLRLSVDPANFVPERTKTNNEADVPLAVRAPSGGEGLRRSPDRPRTPPGARGPRLRRRRRLPGAPVAPAAGRPRERATPWSRGIVASASASCRSLSNASWLVWMSW